MTVEELSKEALALVEQVIKHGKVTLVSDGPNGGVEEREVSTGDIIELAYKLSQVEIKKPQNVALPEGFDLKRTNVAAKKQLE